METNTASSTTKSKAKLKANKKEEKDKNPKGKVGKTKGKEVVLNYAKFEGQGLSYKAKLFGFAEVPGPRGDQTSVQAIQKLKQQAKQLKKGANEHKLKIIFNITLQGIRLFNEKTQTIEHEHPIHKISFISHDPEDRHVFGYIYSPPRSAANETRQYYLFAIKSDKCADAITVQLYELFQVVFKMQENKKIKHKDTSLTQRQQEKTSQPLEPLQDKMLLEMSNKIGGDQQQYPPDEHLYAEPTFAKQAPQEPPAPEYAMPSEKPVESVQTSSESDSNEYKVPRQPNDTTEMESKDLTTSFTLSLSTSSFDSTQESSQPFSDNVSTPTTKNESGFEAVFDSALSFPSDETSNENKFNAEFAPFENGFTSSQNAHVPLAEYTKDSEKVDIPGSSEESPFTNQMSFNAFSDVSPSPVAQQDSETSKIENTDSDGTTPNSTDRDDADSNLKKIEPQAVEDDDEKTPSVDSLTIGNFSSFESESQNDSDVKEMGSSAETTNFATKPAFEVNFDIENDDDKPLNQIEQDVFSFEPSSDAFSSQDPFASTGPTEFDQSPFGAFTDDPFSPKNDSNRGTNSDPFAGSDHLFTADFGDVNTNGFVEAKEDISDETKSENDQCFESGDNEDIFEAMFEAKMEGEMEDETSDDKNENKTQEKTEQKEAEFEEPRGDASAELDDQEQHISNTSEENHTESALSTQNTNETVEVELSNNSFTMDNESSEDRLGNQQTSGCTEENVNEMNTFDFSSSDVYVTLKTAVPPTNRPLSPTEFSPPPLPPRPAPVIPKEPLDVTASPKIPPALPPRPSYQPKHTETVVRRPPELPPRLDLEENSLVESEPMDAVEETNAESFAIDPETPMFEANFDAFDFDSIENNSDSPIGNIGSPTAGFDSSDPFAGADPFQTPAARDPFASSTSFDRDVEHDSESFDPFSGDDPFTMSPSFDAQLSFGSPFNQESSSDDKPSKDNEKDKNNNQQSSGGKRKKRR